MLLTKRFKFTNSSVGLSARKYLRSISESALLYRPTNLKEFSCEESIKDRVVQEFFNSSSLTHRIQVFESSERLSEVTTRSTPTHSYYKFILPFKENEHLRTKMVQFYTNNVRVGRILELMDYIAANVAYRYCSPAAEKVSDLPFIAATAAIDEIDFFHPIEADINCEFEGYVSYAGTSSLEIQIVVTQIVDGKERLACSAKFVMVARDKKTGKAYKVPTFDISNEPETLKIRSELGSKRQKARKIEAAKALTISPPTYEESSEVHNILLKLASEKEKSSYVSIGETKVTNSLLMHLQDKNLSGKIFGGYIMRLAYELGWLTGLEFLGGKFPKCTHIDDVQFLAPVEIGSIIHLQAIVSYVDEELMHVIIEVRNRKAGGETHLTNILRVNMEHNSENMKKVYPITLTESNQYIESMRRVKNYLNQSFL